MTEYLLMSTTASGWPERVTEPCSERECKDAQARLEAVEAMAPPDLQSLHTYSIIRREDYKPLERSVISDFTIQGHTVTMAEIMAEIDAGGPKEVPTSEGYAYEWEGTVSGVGRLSIYWRFPDASWFVNAGDINSLPFSNAAYITAAKL